ncbi:hypothetical protein PHMEG_00037971, partial [Phytophthora megakarya]
MGVPFGGIHILLILLTGDFLQLPPVGTESLFVEPKGNPKRASVDIAAFELWRTFKTNQCDFALAQNRERNVGRLDVKYGQIIPKTYSAHGPNLREVTQKQCVCASPENSTRVAINNQFIVRTAKLTGNNYPIRVVANFKGALQYLSRPEIDIMMNLPDSKFGRIASFLDMIPGMPIQITQNGSNCDEVAREETRHQGHSHTWRPDYRLTEG